MSQRISQNLCSKFRKIKNGKINFAFDPAEKPDTLKQKNNQQKEEIYRFCKICRNYGKYKKL